MSGFCRVNLVSDELRARHLKRVRQRTWAIILMMIVLFCGLGFGAARRLNSDVRQAEASLARLLAETRQDQKDFTRLQVEAEAVARQAAVLDSMRPPVSWAGNLASIAGSVPEGVLLTRLEMQTSAPREGPSDARASKPPGPSTPVGSPAPAPPAEIQVTIDGLALRYDQVAEFLRALGELRVFSTVQLVKSTLDDPSAGGRLVFSVACRR